jgi:tetratricopeptide (TPR) repeat protein
MTTETNHWPLFSPTDLRGPLVGRTSELESLLDSLSLAEEEKQTKIVTILGASGVGKTRLVHEFFQHARSRDLPMPQVYVASARESGDAYAVISRILRARFGLSEAMEAEEARSVARSAVAELLEDRKVGDVLYYLGQFLRLSFPESPLTRAVADDPEQGKLLRRMVLRKFFEADAQREPLVLMFDDLHDAHQDTLELLEYLLVNLVGPILVICLARPELLARNANFTSIAYDRHQVIELAPLREAESAAVMEALLSFCGEPPVALVEAACSQAGGNPMLLERMVRIFQDKGVLLEGLDAQGKSQWNVNLEKLRTVDLPYTLEEAVEARLAVLSPTERRVLERGAAMGQVFWLGGLLALHRMDQPSPEVWVCEGQADRERLRQVLEQLEKRDYLVQSSDCTFPGDQEYVFKYSKERDRLFRTLNPNDVRRYHQMIADWLEHKAQIRSHEEHMGTLARHRELSGSKSRAGMSYLDAGDIARDRFAYQRAADYYERGLNLLTTSDAGRRIIGLHNYGDVLVHLGRRDQALAKFREMKTWAYRLDWYAKGGAAHNRIGRLYADSGKLDQANEQLLAGLELFEKAGDFRGRASSLDDLGRLQWLRGDYTQAHADMRKALVMRRELGDRRGIAHSLNNIGVVSRDCGEFQEAMESFEQALSIRRDIGDVLGIIISLINLGNMAQDQRNYEKALSFFQEAFGIAQEIGDRSRNAKILSLIGDVQTRAGQAEQAIPVLRRAEAIHQELGDKLGLGETLRSLGKAYVVQKDFTQARKCISKAVDIFTEVRSKVHLGMALRTLAYVTAEGGWGAEHSPKCRDYYLRSITIFEEIGNELELARTCHSYAVAVAHVPQLSADESVTQEITKYKERAREIFEKLQRTEFNTPDSLPPEI